MSWRLEIATNGRSSCDECEKPIASGEHRFGRSSPSWSWYHLACAPAGKPRAFKPFMEEAAKLLEATAKKAKRSSKKASTAAKPAPPVRTPDPGIVESLLANPDDPATRAVFADWLQSQGDPFGDVIAYLDAGKQAAAKQLMVTHREYFTGGFGAHLFKWKNGFIDKVSAGGGRREKVISLVETIFALPTAILTRELLCGIAFDSAIAARLTACAPRSLRVLFCWLSNGLSELEIPSLERLSLYCVSSVKYDAKGLQGLFDAERYPNVRELQLLGRIPLPILEALIGSRLLRQLRHLNMSQDCFDDTGARLLLANAKAFRHLVEFGAALPGEHQATFDTRFAHQKAAFEANAKPASD